MEASASAGASAPHKPLNPDSVTDKNVLTEMIQIIGGQNKDGKTNITTSRGQLVLFPGDTIPDTFRTLSLPDSVATPVTSKGGLGALDFLSTVYEENDYYETGFWGREDIPLEKTIYSGPLPPCGLEDFKAPVNGRITSEFGYREKFARFHKGIDIHLCPGDTIRAALSGRVSRKGYERGGYGHFIIVSHINGVETRYAHLQCPLVDIDDVIYCGQPIALGGSSGNSTGPHLHFEIRYLGRAVDPRRIYDF